MNDTERARENGVTVPVLHYIDRLMALHVESEEKLFAEHAHAIDIASTSLSKRLDAMNEIKEAMKDQSAQFITRNEIKPFFDELKLLRSSADRATGRASVASLVAVLGFLVALVDLLIRFMGK